MKCWALILLWVWSLALLFGQVSMRAQVERPNIIYVITDDLGWGDVGFNGQQRINTPVMDKLAAEGAILDNFYAGSPVCGPSRATLMTGRHTGHSRVRGNPAWTLSGRPVDLDTRDMVLAKELKRAGYATSCVGKWGLNERADNDTGHPLNQGFDEFWGFNTHGEAHFHWPDYIWHDREKIDLGGASNWEKKETYVDDLFTEKALDFIDRKAGAGPFFLYLSYTAPHLGISVPEDSQEPYRGLDWPERTMRGQHYRHDAEPNVSYAGMVSRIDGYLEEIVSKLRDNGIEKSTLIIFSSDNGHEFDKGFFDSNGIYTGKKRAVYEGGIRMPAFIYWPGTLKAGTRISHTCAFWDVLPTFCELAGVEPSGPTDGISFVPALMGKGQEVHDYLYWEFNERKGPMQAVRFGDWKAMRHWKENALGPIKLFDLNLDPAEQINLAAKHPELAKRAAAYMEHARSEHPEFPLTKRVRAKR